MPDLCLLSHGIGHVVKNDQEKLEVLYGPGMSSCKKIHHSSAHGLHIFLFGMLSFIEIIILMSNYFTAMKI